MNLLHFRYVSEALGKNTAAYILLPDATRAPFNVMFLLHGLWGDYSDWQRKSSIERYVEELNLLVVMPDGGRGFYVDAVEGYHYGAAIGFELPAIIDGYFRTRPQYCMTGLSMGGFGAIRLALAYPDRFVSSVSHSGAFYVTGPDESADPDIAAEVRRLVGPAPEGGPNDLEHLASLLPTDKRPKLRIDCGVEDHLIEKNRRFHSYLSSIGYDHEYAEYPGAHTWEYWDEHVKEAIDFHRRNLNF